MYLIINLVVVPNDDKTRPIIAPLGVELQAVKLSGNCSKQGLDEYDTDVDGN
jgi:hypothetical protein